MKEKQAKIDCAVFQKRQTAIEDITAKINSAEGVEEKAVFAPELQKEVDVLLCCSDYDKNSLDCKNCHFIAALRSKAAKLIVKAKKLAE
jgi:regulator of protease activity HflC (stomatin/prohibitin superfamily)